MAAHLAHGGSTVVLPEANGVFAVTWQAPKTHLVCQLIARCSIAKLVILNAQGRTAPWDLLGPEPFGPACLKTAGGQPRAFLYICRTFKACSQGRPPVGHVTSAGSPQIFRGSVKPCACVWCRERKQEILQDSRVQAAMQRNRQPDDGKVNQREESRQPAAAGR